MSKTRTQRGEIDGVIIVLVVVATLIGTAAYVCVSRFMAWFAN